MPLSHSASALQALYRVFVQPALSQRPTHPSPFQLPLRLRSAPTSHAPPHPSLTLTQRRSFKKRAPPSRVVRTTPYDEEIRSTYINLVAPDGTFQPSQRLSAILWTYDRKTHHLVQVKPGSPSPGTANSDPDSIPTCKVVSKKELREREQQLEQSKKRQKRQLASSKV
ncbi:hypothetical protein LTS18_000267, partial [Coniosporium uncinatum]